MPSYLGIDASLEGTGLCLVSAVGLVLRSETVLPCGLRDMARLAMIKAATTTFVDGLDVAYTAIEGYAFGAVNQAFSLGEVGGVLRLLVHELGIPRVDVPPVNLKKWATGRVEADKGEMIAAAIADGACPGDHNQADAYFLAQIALALSDDSPETRPRQRSKLEVLRSITSPPRKKTRARPRRLVKNPV
jgi:Holliday junction resolvasome RuvABC endonuclease subunit